MKIIKKSRLPKWIIAKIPYGEEDQTISAIIVPVVLFSLMGIGVLWHELDNSLWIMIKIMVTLILIGIIVAVVWWIMVQIDVLRILRNRAKLHYQFANDDNEKLKIKKELSDLYMNVN